MLEHILQKHTKELGNEEVKRAGFIPWHALGQIGDSMHDSRREKYKETESVSTKEPASFETYEGIREPRCWRRESLSIELVPE